MTKYKTPYHSVKNNSNRIKKNKSKINNEKPRK